MKTFRLWMDLMGFNGKQGSLAADEIGAKYDTITRRRDGEMTKTELLAMSAARLGLKPWSPEYEQEIQQILQSQKDLESARRVLAGSSVP